MDKSSIYTSGALWAWILSNNTQIYINFVVFIPMLLSLLFYSKAEMLAGEYYDQKRHYKNILDTENTRESRKINKKFHHRIIIGNSVIASILILTFNWTFVLSTISALESYYK